MAFAATNARALAQRIFSVCVCVYVAHLGMYIECMCVCVCRFNIPRAKHHRQAQAQARIFYAIPTIEDVEVDARRARKCICVYYVVKKNHTICKRMRM